MRDPETPEEWQEAVDAAEWCLHVDAARQYGLLTGGPKIDVDLAAEILQRGKALGVVPTADCVERLTRIYNGGQ